MGFILFILMVLAVGVISIVSDTAEGLAVCVISFGAALMTASIMLDGADK